MLSRTHERAYLGLAVLVIGACNPSAPTDEAPSVQAEPPPSLPEPRLIAPPITDRLPPSTNAPAPALPPAPVFVSPEVPARHDNGSYSVRGLRAEPDELLRRGDEGAMIVVEGWIIEVYEPTAAAVELGLSAQSHAWIADAPDRRGRREALLVAHYRFDIPPDQHEFWRRAPVVKLEVGKRYRIQGRFVRDSETGFTDPRGLLEFHAYADPERDDQWIHPPGAPWHPLEIHRQEEVERELLQRMSKR